MQLSVFSRIFDQTGLFKQSVGNTNKFIKFWSFDRHKTTNYQSNQSTYAIPSFKLQHSHKITLENV